MSLVVAGVEHSTNVQDDSSILSDHNRSGVARARFASILELELNRGRFAI